MLAYKRKRNIINFSYQTQADNIVGKMTIAALDKEIFEKEQQPVPPAVDQSKSISMSVSGSILGPFHGGEEMLIDSVWFEADRSTGDTTETS